MFGNWTRTQELRKIRKRWFCYALSFVQYCFHFSVLSECVGLIRFGERAPPLVSALTLIRQVWCRNSELWKGQTLTFVCNSGLKWNMMWAAQNGLHAHTRAQLQAHARLQRGCGFDPCFLTLHYSEKSKLKSSLFCSSSTLSRFFSPTPLPLTLARGHPPVDGTIPAAFDTEFALQQPLLAFFFFFL